MQDTHSPNTANISVLYSSLQFQHQRLKTNDPQCQYPYTWRTKMKNTKVPVLTLTWYNASAVHSWCGYYAVLPPVQAPELSMAQTAKQYSRDPRSIPVWDVMVEHVVVSANFCRFIKGGSYMERNMICILVRDSSINMLITSYLVQRVQHHNDNTDNERKEKNESLWMTTCISTKYIGLQNNSYRNTYQEGSWQYKAIKE